MTAETVPSGTEPFGEVPQHVSAPPKDYPVNGKKIRLRVPQMTGWSLAMIFVGPCLIAGGYFAVLQMHWYIHIGSFYWPGWSLKDWWDGKGAWSARGGMGFIKSRSWVLYRHGAFRDLLEPAAAVMLIKTLLAGPKFWAQRVGKTRLIISPPLLLIIAIGLGCGGVWLLDFGLPQAWRAVGLHPVHGPVVTLLGNYSVGILLVGAVIGQVLHRFWGPVGATIQGQMIDRSKDHAKLVNRIPLWVKYPLQAPVVRQRFSWLWDTDKETTKRGTIPRWLLVVIAVVVVLLVVLGGIAKFYIAKGNSVPYLAP
jgi:hypothetical protein